MSRPPVVTSGQGKGRSKVLEERRWLGGFECMAQSATTCHFRPMLAISTQYLPPSQPGTLHPHACCPLSTVHPFCVPTITTQHTLSLSPCRSVPSHYSTTAYLLPVSQLPFAPSLSEVQLTGHYHSIWYFTPSPVNIITRSSATLDSSRATVYRIL